MIKTQSCRGLSTVGFIIMEGLWQRLGAIRGTGDHDTAAFHPWQGPQRLKMGRPPVVGSGTAKQLARASRVNAQPHQDSRLRETAPN